MAEPTISVVIPAFNAARFITDAIESVLTQSFHDLEVVVVDDGSDDETAEMVRRINDPRVQFIQQENQGQSVAINTGVENSKGTYIKLMDSDDWINPTHLESQLSAIQGRQDLVASCRWGYFVENFANPLVKEEHSNQDYDSGLEWLVDSLTKDAGMMGGWMWLIPRNLWLKTGGYHLDLSYCPNNDFQFSISLLLESAGVRFANDAIYSYRKGVSNALSGQSNRNAMASIFAATDMGTSLLLAIEDSPRIRKICADRFQKWLFRFYPEYPDIASETENKVKQLGGSSLEIQGGIILKILKPLIGWKGVRRLQAFIYKYGWNVVLKKKTASRMRKIH